MGFRFRKTASLLPGVRLNLSKRGISSLSIGRRGASINLTKEGIRSTVGLPGSGASYSEYTSFDAAQKDQPGARSNMFGWVLLVAVILIGYWMLG